MGFPAEKLEGVYRNHIDEVYRFLEQMHKGHYKIYNLCSERSYDKSKFHDRVVRYAFEDHAPPKIALIQPFCEDVHKWLSQDPRNVAVVHCKAGKGRTGTMVCCYLLYSGQKATADEALKFYGTERTYDEKGVTIPSQRRYVEYYAALVRSGLQYSATKLHVRELLLSPPPALNGAQCTLELSATQLDPPFKTSLGSQEVRKAASCVRVPVAHCTPLRGDVRLELHWKPKMMRRDKLFHFWINTFFVAAAVGAVRVPPPDDTAVILSFSDTETDGHWDSGETPPPPGLAPCAPEGLAPEGLAAPGAKLPKVCSDHAIADSVTAARPRLSLGDVRASWRGLTKFSDSRKKKHRDDS
ncbi:Phosphatidylinositol-3,4,5-trisphosphate 3-phosphatase and dual-specificity protein phosphatase PTEN [Papilio machaon]|uniref:Phosphatidylinositol 3,4,5-trisphosphate 3-phosphatase and dual-specificity protein phosphatase PTEN n=1 Tax=Papilio machaon TaxID=76193 RepID=A0A194QQN1_PAPMA|nr:Phosphatidylinositol-3,4,5-trisphosphate 3-phosphatase and dual-specificity protein phosphatase PTEN [Papilio machaon]